MYQPENQSPDFHYNVNDTRQKLTTWVGLCGNGDMLGPFFFDENFYGQSYLNLLNDEVIPLMSVISKSIPWKSISTFVVGPGWGPLSWAVRARLNQLFGEFQVYIKISNGLRDLQIEALWFLVWFCSRY